MEMRVLVALLLGLGAVVSAELTDMEEQRVRGPEPLTKREKRSGLDNLFDCPLSWTLSERVQRPSDMPCPPGQERPPLYGRPPYQPYVRNKPCPPWVDDSGRCHANDRILDEATCRQRYGEEVYVEWQGNADLRQPAEPPGTPSPPCRPAELPGY